MNLTTPFINATLTMTPDQVQNQTHITIQECRQQCINAVVYEINNTVIYLVLFNFAMICILLIAHKHIEEDKRALLMTTMLLINIGTLFWMLYLQ